jgi:hypothetical protein
VLASAAQVVDEERPTGVTNRSAMRHQLMRVGHQEPAAGGDED